MKDGFDFLPKGSRFAVIGQGYVGRTLTDMLLRHRDSHYLTVDPLTRHTWREALSENSYDYIINAAGFSGNFRSHALETIESNISLPIDILRLARKPKAYAFVSSTRVYGMRATLSAPASEDDPLPSIDPASIDAVYDGSKILAETLTRFACLDKGITGVSVRLSNIYGNYAGRGVLDDGTLIKKMVRLSLAAEPCQVHQNPLSSKDYIHAADAAEGILRATVLASASATYNIASGVSSTLKEVADLLSVPLLPPPVPGDTLHCPISIQKAQRELAFKPETSLARGLRLTIDQLQENTPAP